MNRESRSNDTGSAGSVTLVGAGCGPGLITVRGLEAVCRADVLVYDDLIDPALLAEARKDCALEYVGKRYGAHSMRQEEINRLLISRAAAGLDVVRLKGGDPYVFGRGGEEVLALDAAGIPCDVIPGVSSAIAVPGHAGIPVTHRGTARSFTVITGHTADGTGENYEALAALSGTLVFLMGKHAYPEITAELIRCGKAPGTPASVISQGFTEDEQRIDGTLGTIAELAADARTPAILVVGDVAAFHMEGCGDTEAFHTEGCGDAAARIEDCKDAVDPAAREGRGACGVNVDETQASKNGTRVTVTGTESFAGRACAVLCGAGFDAQALPTIRIAPHPEVIPADLAAYDWLVFTSANAIRVFFDEMEQRGSDKSALTQMHFACIGSGTADCLRTYGFSAEFVPSEYTAGVLGRELAAHILDTTERVARVLALRARNGSKLLAEELHVDGIAFSDIALYDTEPCDFGSGSDDPYLVFGSAAGVQAYLKRAQIRPDQTPVCIGQYTAEALPAETRERALIADAHTAQGVLQILEEVNALQCLRTLEARDADAADHGFFPLFFDLRGRRILVAGGGQIAARRVNSLLPFGPQITVIAPKADPQIAQAAKEGRLTHIARAVRAEDVSGAELVLAATDDAAANQMLGAACEAEKIPFNRADDRSACDFLFPGIVARDGLVVGITSGGMDHARVRAARERIEDALHSLNERSKI